MVEKIILKGFKRFFLTGIKEFVYEPKSRLQLILGTNGSGKSSLLYEITPLPADLSKMYEEDGSKEVYLAHRENKYYLTSGVVKGKHEFYVNNENLNPGGTRKVQLSLVKEHFGITPFIHDVMVGKKKFHEMTIPERKDWLMGISDIDYDYVLNVYNTAKRRHRDIIGTMRVLQTKLDRERNLEVSDEVIRSLKNKNNQLQKLISAILKNQYIVTNDHEDVEKSIKSINDYLKKHIHKSFMYKSNDQYLKHMYSLEQNIEKNQNEINEINEFLSKEASLDSETNMAEVLEKLAEIDRIISTMGSDIPFMIKGDIFYIYFISVYPEIISILTQLKEFHTIDELCEKDVRLDLDKLRIKLFSYEKRHELLNREILILEANKAKDDITCRNCGNTWKEGYDKTEYNNKKTELEESIINISSLENEIKEREEIVRKIKHKNELFSSLKNLTTRGDLGELTDKIYPGIDSFVSDIVKYCSDIERNLFILKNELEVVKEYPLLMEEKKHLEKMLTILEGIDESKLNAIKIERETKELDLARKIGEIKNLKTSLADLKSEHGLFLHLKEKSKELKSHLSLYNKQKETALMEYKNDLANSIVTNIKERILESNDIINRHEQNKIRLHEINKELGDYNNRKDVLEKMIKELSPTDGLIADSIISFLEVFTSEMNEVISKVWSYAMEVKPCGIDNTDLTFKFPVLIENQTELSNDVSQLSSSQKEIVNLAFKLVSMQYLGIQYYPVYLDEFGGAMDEEHRENAYRIPDILIEYQQIFMVSHYQSFYGRFSHVDTTILSEKNMTLNGVGSYNNVAKIKRNK